MRPRRHPLYILSHLYLTLPLRLLAFVGFAVRAWQYGLAMGQPLWCFVGGVVLSAYVGAANRHRLPGPLWSVLAACFSKPPPPLLRAYRWAGRV